MLVVLQAHHGHQEALDHLPGLSAVVGLRVGTLQAVQGRLNGLQPRTANKGNCGGKKALNEAWAGVLMSSSLEGHDILLGLTGKQ